MRMTSPPSCAECHEIWEPKPPGTLWATPGPLRDSFTFTISFSSSCNDGYACLISNDNLDIKHPTGVSITKVCFIQLPITHNKLPVNVLQLQRFLFKFL